MKRFELGITIFNLLIKAPHSYSSDDTIPKNNHFLVILFLVLRDIETSA